MAIRKRPVSDDRSQNSTTDEPATVRSRMGLPRRIGPYRLKEQLGKGGMGTVYSAYDEDRGRRVALKRIRPEAAARPCLRARFRREARTAARLDHPGIVKVYDIFTAEDGDWADGGDWIVMELVEGQRLDHLLQSGALGIERVLELAVEIAAALAAAHAAGVVHRDLKAGNILVTPAGHAKILDFGLAKQVLCSDTGESSISVAGQLLGTPHSMSPEQAMGHDVDLRSDLFSLGSLLYLMLTGTYPFVGSNALQTLKKVCIYRQPRASDVRPEVPRWLSDLVDRLLEKDPAHRPRHAGEVVTALRRRSLLPDAAPSESDTAPTIAFDGAVASRALVAPRPVPVVGATPASPGTPAPLF
jgi:eukaryotic-like serine/threonine-protein kinase